MIDEIHCPWCGHTHVYKTKAALVALEEGRHLGEHNCNICGQLFKVYFKWYLNRYMLRATRRGRLSAQGRKFSRFHYKTFYTKKIGKKLKRSQRLPL